MRKHLQLLLKQLLFSKLTCFIYQVNLFCMKSPPKRRVSGIVKKQLLKILSGTLIFMWELFVNTSLISQF